MPVKARKLLF